MFCGILFFITLFLIGFTEFIPYLATLQTISTMMSALVFVLIIIYGLRNVSEKPDKKVGTFIGIKESGWILGLLIPALIVDSFGINIAFYLIFVVGVFWLFFMYQLTKKYKYKPKIEIKASFSFLQKIPLLIVLKSMDLAVFTTFLYFFPRERFQAWGYWSMGLMIVIVEVVFFALSTYLIGKISNKSKRKYWVPACIISHIIGILIMLNATTLPGYFLAAILFGVAGGFIDVWVFSKISETIKKYDKGLVYGTFGWSYDFATILGVQMPVIFVMFGFNQFASMFVFPGLMIIAYLWSKKKQ